MKIYLFITSLLFAVSSYAEESMRPQSKQGSYLFEINFGTTIKKGNRYIPTYGFDFEYVIPGTKHSLLVGLATDVEFDHHEEYYIGPILSYFPIEHFKLIYSTGYLFEKDHKYRLNRYGAGYEFFPNPDLIIIPTFAVDHVKGKQNTLITIGCTHEF